jgi:hypothetical protein
VKNHDMLDPHPVTISVESADDTIWNFIKDWKERWVKMKIRFQCWLIWGKELRPSYK